MKDNLAVILAKGPTPKHMTRELADLSQDKIKLLIARVEEAEQQRPSKVLGMNDQLLLSAENRVITAPNRKRMDEALDELLIVLVQLKPAGVRPETLVANWSKAREGVLMLQEARGQAANESAFRSL